MTQRSQSRRAMRGAGLVVGWVLAGAWAVPASAVAAPVTGVYGTFNGYWSSRLGAISTTRPDDTNLLLGFAVGGSASSVGTVYSTGVNDALLTSQGVTFTPQEFRALPVTGTIAPQYIGIGMRWGGIDQDAADDDSEVRRHPERAPNYYLDDGDHGLELGTALFNLAAGSVMRVPVDGTDIDAAHVTDAIPDIIVTQVGDPGRSDRFRFYGENDTPLGNEVQVDFSAVSAVGNADWMFYHASTRAETPGVKGARAVRLVAFTFAELGIAPATAPLIREFRVTQSGQADPAFIAYNATSVPVRLPTLSLSKTGSGAVAAGGTASYQLQVRNAATARASSSGTLYVTDMLPAGLTPTAASGSGWTCSVGAQEVSCSSVAVLAPGEAAPPITVTADVQPDAPASVTNTATLHGGGDTACPADPRCQASVTSAVESPALTLSKTVQPAPLQRGGTATFVLTVRNMSSVAASVGAVTVTDTLPAGLTPTSAGGDGWACSATAQTVHCTATGAIAPGASAPPITVLADVLASAPAQLTNQASLSGGGDAGCPAAPRCQAAASAEVRAAVPVPTLGAPMLAWLGLAMGAMAWRRGGWRRRG